MLGLSPRRVLDALSLVMCQAVCPGEIKYDRDTVIRAIREAFPAQAAVLAAELAGRGVRGFAEPLEGRAGFFALFAGGAYDPAVLLEGLGDRFWIENLSFKPWPCCRGTHAYVEAVIDLRARHGFDWRAVEAVECDGGEVQRMLVEPVERKRAPATAIDAKFSIFFTVAAALVHGSVTLESFSGAALSDPDVLALAARVTFNEVPGWGRERAASGRVSIRLKDGRTFEAGHEVALGHPSRPMSEAALRAKFIDCAGRAAQPIPRDRAERLADAILSIETMTSVAALAT